jgi:UDP-N-acetylmuramoyl-L-alanyl-D-glutamate--2,6-diaminopimelate ligase
MKKLIPQSIKNIYHLAQAVAANVRYGFPSRKIKVIGITGTNGKTTTCQMIAKILEESGARVAMVSTINFKLGDVEWVNATKFTTVSAFDTQKFIASAVKAGCEYLVLETSSHSLDQYRVWGVKYDTAVITNVTREHLDYHATMEEYQKAKAKLFENAKTAIVNLDMDRPEDFLNYGAGRIYGYSAKNQNVNLTLPTGRQEMQSDNAKLKIINAKNIKLGMDGSEFEVHRSKTGAQLLELQKLSSCFKLNLPGLFNIENALAAISVGISEKIDLPIIKKALEKITKVSGRMDEVENKLGLKIIIDYAVTPDSMEKLGELISGQKTASQSLIWVFGSCGERDRGKRPIMGEIVAKYADYAIVTNEDPYGEDPQAIIDAVFVGVLKKKKLKENKNCWRILDRKEAIGAALKIAKAGDIILVTGKGAEEIMAVGKKRIPWNDRMVIEEELKKV